MDNFVVSARKYRPSTFDSVVGQQSITNTLKNAIKTGHLAQAFLFCGSRGVGKTTCARILAKTINCSNRKDNIEACNECDSCTSFNEGASLNIHELDAASNNSVDDIRNLIDQVRFAPQIGDYKVYIIDEVHMLSGAAFNAFLKTLEEPPSHAIFILATTEKHKIIPTILSRCQIFDFNRIGVKDISNHLKYIAEKEGVTAEDEGLSVIAQKAEGALRDALSMFDQMVTFAGNNLTYEDVIKNLNILDYDYYFKATDFILQGEISNSLLLFNEILSHGFDGHLFINGLASHFRNLLVCQDEATLQLLEVGESVKDKYKEQANACNIKFLLPALEICRQCDMQYKGSKNQRLLVELSLMQLASILSEANPMPQKKKFRIKSEDSSTSKKENPTPNEEAPIKEQSAIVKTGRSAQETAPKETIEELKSQASKTIKEELKKEESLVGEKKESYEPKTPKKRRTSALSLSELTKDTHTEEALKEKAEYSSDLREDFKEEQLLQKWEALIQKIKEEAKEGSSIVLAAMNSRKPILQEDYKIELLVDNKSQLEEMKLARTDIHEFLRKQLRNGAIELLFKVNKEEKLRKAYTDEEKFAKMAEKNPLLHKLRSELDLDFF